MSDEQQEQAPQSEPGPVGQGRPRSARIVIEVTAGLVPGKPDPEFTRRYFIASDDWWVAKEKADAGDAMPLVTLLTETNGQAQAYAAWLMTQAGRLNWVRLDWIYL